MSEKGKKKETRTQQREELFRCHVFYQTHVHVPLSPLEGADHALDQLVDVAHALELPPQHRLPGVLPVVVAGGARLVRGGGLRRLRRLGPLGLLAAQFLRGRGEEVLVVGVAVVVAVGLVR